MTRSQSSRLLRKTNRYFPYLYLIVLQHALHEIAQRSPEVFAPVCKTMLVNEQNVVLEACVQMWLEPQLNDDRVVVAVDVGVDTVENGTPIRLGNICSLSTLDCTHAIRCSMYSGADILVGRL
jgi:hypothetical protein